MFNLSNLSNLSGNFTQHNINYGSVPGQGVPRSASTCAYAGLIFVSWIRDFDEGGGSKRLLRLCPPIRRTSMPREYPSCCPREDQ